MRFRICSKGSTFKTCSQKCRAVGFQKCGLFRIRIIRSHRFRLSSVLSKCLICYQFRKSSSSPARLREQSLTLQLRVMTSSSPLHQFLARLNFCRSGRRSSTSFHTSTTKTAHTKSSKETSDEGSKSSETWTSKHQIRNKVTKTISLRRPQMASSFSNKTATGLRNLNRMLTLSTAEQMQ